MGSSRDRCKKSATSLEIFTLHEFQDRYFPTAQVSANSQYQI
jgi:hypothetical protein